MKIVIFFRALTASSGGGGGARAPRPPLSSWAEHTYEEKMRVPPPRDSSSDFAEATRKVTD